MGTVKLGNMDHDAVPETNPNFKQSELSPNKSISLMSHDNRIHKTASGEQLSGSSGKRIEKACNKEAIKLKKFEIKSGSKDEKASRDKEPSAQKRGRRRKCGEVRTRQQKEEVKENE